jgi:hypothetical protein
MSSHEVHNSNDMVRFGESFDEVHKDLDRTYRFGYTHRKNTHHLEYVLEKISKKEWTLEQAVSAIHHIIDDCGVLMLKKDWETSDDLIEQVIDQLKKQEEMK